MALRILDEDEKGISHVDTPGGSQQSLIISEPGLCKLLGRSKKPEARVKAGLRTFRHPGNLAYVFGLDRAAWRTIREHHPAPAAYPKARAA